MYHPLERFWRQAQLLVTAGMRQLYLCHLLPSGITAQDVLRLASALVVALAYACEKAGACGNASG